MNSPPEIAKLCVNYGVNKLEKPLVKTFVLAIIGGFFIGASSVLSNICSYNYSGGIAQFYSGIVFPIGTMAVYCAGAELFTGNILLTLGLFNGNIYVLNMLLNWLITLVGNFIGALIVALLVVYGHIPNMFNVHLAQTIITFAIEKVSSNFGETFIKALLCNFFNCLAIWVSMGGKDFRSVIVGLWTPIFLYQACNLDHYVADVYYIIAGIFASYEYDLDRTSLGWGKLFYKSIIPVVLGNIFGGGLVGMGYYYVYLTKDYPEIKVSPQNLDSKRFNTTNNSTNNIIINNEPGDLTTLHAMNK